jgi:hypothetical protein
MNPPPMTAVDRLLWPRVSSLIGYLELLLLITVIAPLALGAVLPPTTAWLTCYVVCMVGLTSAAATVQASRDRWIAWHRWTNANRRRGTRQVIDALIERDRSRA